MSIDINCSQILFKADEEVCKKSAKIYRIALFSSSHATGKY